MSIRGLASTARIVEAVSTKATINTAIRQAIIANAEADQGTEQNKEVISRGTAWSLKHQAIEDKKDHRNVKVRFQGLISTTARTEEKIMIAAVGEETTETTAISQDLPT